MIRSLFTKPSSAELAESVLVGHHPLPPPHPLWPSLRVDSLHSGLLPDSAHHLWLCGSYPRGATSAPLEVAGLPVGKLTLVVCFLAGSCAGLAWHELKSAAVQRRLNESIVSNYGYAGILVAFLLSRHNPLATVLVVGSCLEEFSPAAASSSAPMTCLMPPSSSSRASFSCVYYSAIPFTGDSPFFRIVRSGLPAVPQRQFRAVGGRCWVSGIGFRV